VTRLLHANGSTMESLGVGARAILVRRGASSAPRGKYSMGPRRKLAGNGTVQSVRDRRGSTRDNANRLYEQIARDWRTQFSPENAHGIVRNCDTRDNR